MNQKGIILIRPLNDNAVVIMTLAQTVLTFDQFLAQNGDDAIASPLFPDLKLTASQILDSWKDWCSPIAPPNSFIPCPRDHPVILSTRLN